MDFDAAARRLEKDQLKLRGRRGGSAVVSEKAKREAAYRKKQQEVRKQELERKRQQLAFVQQYFTTCERGLGVTSLAQDGLKLIATSIHGDGDKISLPPSVLQRLTTEGTMTNDGEGSSSPWTFRVGILNPNYKFPASKALQTMQPPEDDDGMDEESDDDEHVEPKAAYLEELAQKYLSYSHGTVVEFTQEEGHVGLPASIAAALFVTKQHDVVIQATRTKDPSGGGGDDAMATDDDEKTAGHLAWGAFDLPNLPIEITLVKLPKGRKCTLVPTKEAIQAGFYSLKDIKLVIEQSIIRTRATLSLGDMIHTWHRGAKYDLTVTKLSPVDYGAVSCINTDIEVDFGSNKEVEKELAATTEAARGQMLGSTTSIEEEKGSMLGIGYTLSSSSAPASPSRPQESTVVMPSELLPEPPTDQTEDVCTVQIRAPDGVTGRRRLDVNVATLEDLFAFAATLVQQEEANDFRLVTRFPRRVLSINDQTLSQAGIAAGQELFLVERN